MPTKKSCGYQGKKAKKETAMPIEIVAPTKQSASSSPGITVRW
ncbi:hypothetical protein [Pseudoclavibacter helvolus]